MPPQTVVPPPTLPPFNFSGKRALVTGAASGIGRSITEALAACGAHVAALDCNAAGLQDLRQQWLNNERARAGGVAGGDISTHVVDLADWEATRALVQQNNILPVDLCVNCAGTQDPNQRTNFLDLPIETFRRVHAVNVEAVLNLTQLCARSMVDNHCANGAIVNISSVSSQVSWPGYGAYCPSKASVDMVSRMAARDLGEYKIRVNTVNHGVVMTPLGQRQWFGKDHGDKIGELEADASRQPERVKLWLDRTPMGRFCRPYEITNVVLFLLSDFASMINGQNIIVDGGWTA